MTATILSTSILIAGAIGVLAQGFVDFSNAPWEAWPEPTPPDRLIYLGSIAPGNAIADSAYTAALFEDVGGTWVKLGGSIGFYGPGLEGILATDFIARQLHVQKLTATTLQIRVYDPAGSELPVCEGNNTFSYTEDVTLGPCPECTLMINLRAFAVVPESSTIALGALGLGVLLLFRRRKLS